MHRFFITKESFQGDQVTIAAEQAHQIRNVLRMRPGQRVVVLDNEGWEFELLLDQVDRSQVAGTIMEKRAVHSEAKVEITLYQSLIKRDKFEWVLQKCTELGAARIVPMVSQFTIVNKQESLTPKKVARWQRILTEAAEQSGRGRIPQLMPTVTFEQAVDGMAPEQVGLIPWERTEPSGARTLSSCIAAAAEIALFIGPEGGFSEAEVVHAQQGGIVPISLGARILRAETAAVVATTLVMYESGELS